MENEYTKNTPPFSSNAERLSGRDWFGLLLVLTFLGVVAGPLWARFEPFEPTSEYRLPFNSSEDYWLFDRFCRTTDDSGRSLVMGDSFVWGQFVGKEETLTSFLNREAESERFVNAGLDGSHPLAMEGLIKHYCDGLRNRHVILHLNLLWVSSPQADLQLERGPRFNHPRLVPQFSPVIPSYDAPITDRLGIVLARHVPLLDWSKHLQVTYFENDDLAQWTLEHPYKNPLRRITPSRPVPESLPHPDPQAWFVDGAARQAPPWVELETSLQWAAFKRVVEFLQTRGNDLFIVVGPLNEHMLEASNAEVYRQILEQAEAWLNSRGLPYHIPALLPSGFYADMSHPLSEGYAILAQELWGHLSG